MSLDNLFKLIENGFTTEGENEFKRLLESDVDINAHHQAHKYTLLGHCAKLKRTCWIQCLLKNGADPSQKWFTAKKVFETASDIAWLNKDYDTLAKLIIADGPFPRNFDDEKLDTILTSNSSSESDKIRLTALKFYIQKLRKLHDQIEDNKIEDVEKFIRITPKARYAYNLQNTCALATALKAKNFQIYSLLKCNQFAVGIFDEEFVRSEVKKLYKTEPIHILDLMARSRIYESNDKKFFVEVRKCYDSLNEIDDIKIILQLVAKAPKVSITFDFNSNSVCDLDPTACSDENVKGRTYERTGRILIAAKRDNHAELLGTVAHELTHYALFLVYDNGCRPYFANDLERRKEFQKIAEKCSKSKSQHEIIENAFSYNPESIPIELIVRVPQILVQLINKTQELLEIRETFEDLFIFFTNQVMPDLEKEVSLIEAKTKAQNFNKSFGLFEKLLASNFLCQYDKVNFFKVCNAKKNIFITSPTPELTLASLIASITSDKKKTEQISSKNMFIEMRQLTQKYYQDLIFSLLESNLDPTIYVLATKDDDIEKYKIIIDQLITKVVIITNQPYCSKYDRFEPFNYTFAWADLKDQAKSEILQSNFVFQGSTVKLEDMISNDSEILQNIPLDSILQLKNQKSQEFENTLPKGLNIFIERTYAHVKNSTEIECDKNDVSKILLKNRCVVLAAMAGMGKTTSAINFAKMLKQENPKSWVFFVDLKQHAVVYQKDNQNQHENFDPAFFSKQLLKFDSEFEEKLFEHHYSQSKIFFVIDGFDEISPLYKKFVLNMIKSIKESGNCSIVTTRIHLAEELRNKLGIDLFSLKPFSRTDQIQFIENFWRKSPTEAICALRENIGPLLEKMNQNFVAVPLQLYMMVEVYSNSAIVDFGIDLFSLYQHFMAKTMDIWNTKGKLFLEDNKVIQWGNKPVNIKFIHLKFAIQSIFGNHALEDLDFPDVPEFSSEVITRVGLIKVVQGNMCEFTHKTFAEFMIADYCFDKMTSDDVAEKALKIIRKICLDADYENIRNFIHEKLQTVESEVFEKYWSTVVKCFNEKDQKTILYHNCSGMLKEFIGNANALQIVLENMGKHLSEYDFRKFLKNEDWLLDVVSYFAFFAEDNVFLKIWEFIEHNFANIDDRKSFLTRKFNTTKNVLVFSCTNRNKSTTKAVFSIAKKFMTNEEIKKELTESDSDGCFAFHHALLYGNIENYLEVFQKEFKIKLEKDDISALLLSKNMIIPLSCFNFDIQTWNFISKYLTPLQMKSQLFESRTSANAFVCAASYNKLHLIHMLKWLKQNFNLEDGLKKVFCDPYSKQSNFLTTFLHYVALKCDESLARSVLKFLSECQFDDRTIRQILLAEKNYGETPLYDSLFNECETTVRAFWEIYEKFLSSENLELLISKLDMSADDSNQKKPDAIMLLQVLINKWRKNKLSAKLIYL